MGLQLSLKLSLRYFFLVKSCLCSCCFCFVHDAPPRLLHAWHCPTTGAERRTVLDDMLNDTLKGQPVGRPSSASPQHLFINTMAAHVGDAVCALGPLRFVLEGERHARAKCR